MVSNYQYMKKAYEKILPQKIIGAQFHMGRAEIAKSNLKILVPQSVFYNPRLKTKTENLTADKMLLVNTGTLLLLTLAIVSFHFRNKEAMSRKIDDMLADAMKLCQKTGSKYDYLACSVGLVTLAELLVIASLQLH